MKPTLKVAEPVDPHLENVMERLFEGRQAKDFGDLIKKFARFHLDRDGAWVSGEILLLELREMLEYAATCATEEEAENKANEYPESGAL